MRRLSKLILLAAVCAGSAAAVGAQGDPRPLGPDVALHEGPGCDQDGLNVSGLPGGGFVAVWRGNPFGAPAARLFDAEGRPSGPPFAVSLYRGWTPRVMTDAGGGFRVAWENEEGLWTRTFSPSGDPLGPEVLVASPVPELSSMAPLGDGGFVVVTMDDDLVVWRYTAEGQPAGSQVLVSSGGLVGVVPPFSEAAAAPYGRSGVIVVWTELREGAWSLEGRILDFERGTSIPFGTGPLGSAVPFGLAVVKGAAGTILVSWEQRAGRASRLFARAFGVDGVPVGEAFLVEPALTASPRGAAMAGDSAGNFLVSWIGTGEVYLRRFSPRGTPLGASQGVNTGTYRYGLFLPPVLAITTGDRLMVGWQPTGFTFPSGPHCSSDGLFARFYDASTDSLPLQGGRFQVSVRWTDRQGNTGEGRPVALTADSGYFWFFGPDNLELMGKVLDGRAINGRFWFSYASLSDVAYTITVTDTVTGTSKEYENPAGRLANQADTSTFVAPAAAASLQQASSPSTSPLSDTAAGPCAAGEQPRRPGLCLGNRFEVEVAWTAPSVGAGAGQGVVLTTDSGYFWFFGASNIEIVVKILDGRPVNGHFWVFFGTLTDVEHRLTVRDTVTGEERVYVNPPGQLRSRADTAAF